MTKDKAQKTAARQRMAETGEPYSVARRAVANGPAEDQARAGMTPEEQYTLEAEAAGVPTAEIKAQEASFLAQEAADLAREQADRARERADLAGEAADKADERADLAQEAAQWRPDLTRRGPEEGIPGPPPPPPLPPVPPFPPRPPGPPR